jgi:N-acetylmuramoyl-L-alanine amidase
MERKLSARTKALRNIGVKQAPFVVLIGAAMPSVLAEMSFVTNKQDAALLKTGVYRQQIAEALFDAVLRYQQSLKKMRSSTAAQSSAR